MFFVPIAFVFLVVWFIGYIYKQIGYGKYNRAEYQVEQGRKRAAVMLQDEALATKFYNDLDKKYTEQAKIVREFMGGDRKWDEFSLGCGRELATLVLLAQQGRTSSGYIIGNPINCSYKLGERAPAMIEEFVLRLEDELNRHRGGCIRAMIKMPHQNGYQQWFSLRDYIVRNGNGKTYRTALYRFE